jgi:hypothetical protein
MRFIIAIFASVLPRRLWPAMEKHVPVSRAVVLSGIASFFVAMAIGIPAYLRFVETAAGAATDQLLQATGWRPMPVNASAVNVQVGQGAWGLSFLSPFVFAFFTPVGLLSLYLTFTGWFRAVSAYVDDARGDPLLTVVDGLIHRARIRRADRRAQDARHQLEGAEVADRVLTGEAAGLPEAVWVVVASRRKPEWVAGAFVITEDKWYRINPPLERTTPNGVRTLYPLTEVGEMEVLRNGIRYDLSAHRARERLPGAAR